MISITLFLNDKIQDLLRKKNILSFKKIPKIQTGEVEQV